jgi:ABC-type bacteriocin/lantibiotic exporter with double-glycine peptidase domain
MDEDPRRVRLVRQRDDWDCGLAVLAMVFDLRYDDVQRAVAADIATVASRHGLVLEQLVAIAAALGRSLRPVQAVEGRVIVAADRVAILGVLLDAGHATERAHWTVLHRGAILCPHTGAVAPLPHYLTAHRAEAFTLLVAA